MSLDTVMISVLIASAVLGQWKGWDGAAGKPSHIPMAAPVRPGLERRRPEAFAPVPVPVGQRRTSDLVVRLAALRERAAELSADMARNVGHYRAVSNGAAARGGNRPAPMAMPAAQAARYVSLHKRMRHQWTLVRSEIAAIEAELRRRGVEA